MTTVFNREYLDNAARIKSSAEELRNSKSKPKTQAQAGTIGFSKTLRELEAEANRGSAKEIKALDKAEIKPLSGSSSAKALEQPGSETKQEVEAKISLLSSTFADAQPGLAPWETSEIFLKNVNQRAGQSAAALCLNPVNKPDSAVNSLTGKNAFKPALVEAKFAQTDSVLPAPPLILEARQVELTATGLPSESRVLSAVRLGTPKVSSSEKQEKVLGQIISTAARYHGIEDELGMAIAKVESGLNPRAVSKDGHNSKGIFQLLDSTAMDMREVTGMREPYDPFDPAQNAYLGLAYLKRLNKLFSAETTLTRGTKTVGAKSEADLEKISLAAYNAGEGRIARAQARAKAEGKDPQEFAAIEPYIPASTRQYVRKVLGLKETLLAKNQRGSEREMEV